MRVIWINYSKGDFRTALSVYTVRVLDYASTKWVTVHWFKHDESCTERNAESGVSCCAGKTRMPDPIPQFYATHAKVIARNQLLKKCAGFVDDSYAALGKIYKSPNLCALMLLTLKHAERRVICAVDLAIASGQEPATDERGALRLCEPDR